MEDPRPDDRRPTRQSSDRPLTPVTVGPIDHDVRAPLALVYQMLAAVGQGAEQNGERADILRRDGNELVCDFWTRVTIPGGIGRLVRTRERVRLRPPDRVDFEHLDGPVEGLRESITLASADGHATRMTYRGIYHPRGRIDALRARLLVRPAIGRIMREHFEGVRGRAEARASRSRVFPP